MKSIYYYADGNEQQLSNSTEGHSDTFDRVDKNEMDLIELVPYRESDTFIYHYRNERPYIIQEEGGEMYVIPFWASWLSPSILCKLVHMDSEEVAVFADVFRKAHTIGWTESRLNLHLEVEEGI
jgi:hypothetical protein